MEFIKCINRHCGKEYPKNFQKCPQCGTINPWYAENSQKNTPKNNRILNILISIIFAMSVLGFCFIIITAVGWGKSVGAKGLITGIAIAAGTWCESFLNKKSNSPINKDRIHNKNKKPRKGHTLFIVVSVLLLILIPVLIIFTSPNYAFKKVKKDNTVEAYINFVNKHPKTKIANEARDSVVSIYRRQYSILEIPIIQENITIGNTQFKNNPVGYEKMDVQLQKMLREMRDERVNQAYNDACKTNTIEGWEYYVSIVPFESQRDAQQKINKLKEDILWESEPSAWNLAVEKNNVSSFEKYLSLYPNGRHVRQAEKRMIDLEVDRVFAGEYRELPAMNKTCNMGTSYSILELENRTEYDLTINYSGPDSKRIVIAPHKTKELHIGNGNYRVAASVGHGVIPYANKESIDGGRYSSYFYITTRNKFDFDFENKTKYPSLYK